MKATLNHGELLITGETEFEDAWLSEFAPLGVTVELQGFTKTGLSASDFLGFKIVRKDSDRAGFKENSTND